MCFKLIKFRVNFVSLLQYQYSDINPISDENKVIGSSNKKILCTKILRMVWRTVRRITNDI